MAKISGQGTIVTAGGNQKTYTLTVTSTLPEGLDPALVNPIDYVKGTHSPTKGEPWTITIDLCATPYKATLVSKLSE